MSYRAVMLTVLVILYFHLLISSPFLKCSTSQLQFYLGDFKTFHYLPVPLKSDFLQSSSSICLDLYTLFICILYPFSKSVMKIISINGLKIDPYELLKIVSLFKSKTVKATLWVWFFSQLCALSNASCLACLWKCQKGAERNGTKRKVKTCNFLLATRLVTLTRTNNRINTSNITFFRYCGSSS